MPGDTHVGPRKAPADIFPLGANAKAASALVVPQPIA